MTVTINDPAMFETFASITGTEVKILGPDGQVLGRFRPEPRPGMMFPEFGLSDEEVERRDNDPNAVWLSAEQVSARIRELREVK